MRKRVYGSGALRTFDQFGKSATGAPREWPVSHDSTAARARGVRNQTIDRAGRL